MYLLDETRRVARATTGAAERALERSQRTDPTEQFDGHAPGRRWQMSHRHPVPAERKEAAEQHEHDEHDVKEENEIRKALVNHLHESAVYEADRPSRGQSRDACPCLGHVSSTAPSLPP